MKSEYNKFHDATFLGCSFDWKSGDLKLLFKLCNEKHSNTYIVAKNIKSFTCTREYPWGESVSVNELLLDELKATDYRMKLEMQSGDIIKIIANLFKIIEE